METGQVDSVSPVSLKPTGERDATAIDSAPDREFVAPELAMRPVPVSRKFCSLQVIFLTVTLSSVLLILLTFFTYLEINDRDSAIRRIDVKLSEMLDSGSILLADATAERNQEKALLVLAPVLGVPDITGVAIDLPDGTRFAEHGHPLDAHKSDTVRRRDIIHIVDDAPARIGTLLVGLSYDEINREQKERVIRHAVLAALILAAIIFSMHQSLRLIVMSPMRRLLSSIQSWQENGSHTPVEWARNDEFGQLIDAFNRMQLQQQFYQRNLKVALSDAEAADQAKSAFLAIISHELRTPLNAIIGFSDMLKSSYEDLSRADREEYLEHVNVSGNALLDLVNDILDITSAQAGRLELNRTPFDPIVLVRELAEGSLDERITVAVTAARRSPAADAAAIADVPRLKRALRHLLDNACKATPPDGKISIGAETRDGELRLSIDDTGEGLSTEEYASLSGPFSNGDGKWQNHQDGAGLGLTYVHTVARLHNGGFTLERNSHAGTRATIFLPAGN